MQTFLRVSALLLLVGSLASGAAGPDAEQEVSELIPGKDASIVLRLPGFKPSERGFEKTILDGRFDSDIIITVVAEREQGEGPEAARDRYYPLPRKAVAAESAFHHFSVGAVPFAAYKMPSIGGMEASHLHAFFTGEGHEFDVHLSTMVTPENLDASLKRMKAAALTFRVRPEVPLTPAQRKAREIYKLHVKGNSTDAFQAVERLLADNPREPYAHYVKGEILYKNGDFKGAVTAYRQAVSLWEQSEVPTRFRAFYADSLDGLGLALAQSGNMKEAKTALDKELAYARSNRAAGLIAQASYNMACWHAESANTAKALRYLKEAVAFSERKRSAARNDDSFRRLKNEPEFRKITEPDRQ
jgi:hypothetical protein